MKYYLIAGERSGDLHGSNLIKALQKEDPDASFRAWGGDYMQDAGAKLVIHYREMAIMGFMEVLQSLGKIRRFLKKCQKDIKDNKPNLVILIDFAGFNLRIAKFAKNNGFKVFYYISPKLWAWNQSRVKKVKKYVDRMFVILPFEQEFYQKHQVHVDYVGNPVVDAVNDFTPINNFHEKYGLKPNVPIIALLPGSRKQEVSRHLTSLKNLARSFPEWQFALSVVNNLPDELYQMIDKTDNVTLIPEDNYNLLLHAHSAVVVSGTATLETALFDIPQVVIYKTSTISYHIARRLIRVNFISLVNLIAGSAVVKELIQDLLTTNSLREEVQRLTLENSYRLSVLQGYKIIREKLGNENASKKAAGLIFDYLTAENKVF